MITIIDYGAGNPGSVKRAFEYIGEDCMITSKPEDILKSERIVLPGVGTFGDAMKNLNEKKLVQPIKTAIEKGTPFLGICLGLQLLFEGSEESPGTEGLGIFKGKCLKFKEGKIPQIGWNSIVSKNETLLKRGFNISSSIILKKSHEMSIPFKENIAEYIIGNGGFAYFVNSYYVKPDDENIISATTNYNINFACAVRKDNVFAVQFHPEKSGDYGLEILRRWLSC